MSASVDRSASRAERVFVASWSLLAASVFLSVGAQMDDTFGPSGMMPLTETAALPFWAYPTLLHLAPFTALSWLFISVGAGAALAAAAGVRRPLMLGVTALCWLQLSAASPTLLGMPPDFILLHGTLAAALMSSPRTAAFGHLLARLVLAKLYLEAGLAKLVYPGGGGFQEWVSGGFPPSFFAVVPLPGLLARFWHHTLSAELQSTFAAIVAVGQVGGGLLVFGPRPARIAAFLFLTGFQLFLLTAANFGALCWGSLLLGCTLLIEPSPTPGIGEAWRSLFRRATAGAGWGVHLVRVWMVAQLVQMGADATQIGEHHPARTVVQGWRLANRYSMFLTVPRRRVEWRYASLDANGEPARVHLLPWQLDVDHTVGVELFTHHPRLVFLLWFNSTIHEAADWPTITRMFANNERADLVVPATRWFGAWICMRDLDRDARVRLTVDEVGYGPPDRDGWWQATTLAVSEPVACSDLIDTYEPPWALMKRNHAWGR